jgi:hypothetical protein
VDHVPDKDTQRDLQRRHKQIHLGEKGKGAPGLIKGKNLSAKQDGAKMVADFSGVTSHRARDVGCV